MPYHQYLTIGSATRQRLKLMQYWYPERSKVHPIRTQVLQPERDKLKNSLHILFACCAQDPSDATILVYSRSQGWELQYRLTGHTDSLSSLAVSPCGHLLASGAWDGKVRVILARNNQKIKGR